MAVFAGLRESRLHVVGIGRVLEILQVARNASRNGKVVVPVDVALGARRGHVRAGQREPGFGMIETRVRPRRSVVADSTGRGNTGLHMVGIGRALIVLHMARGAIGGSSCELAVDVAQGAGHGHVSARQREFAESIVIKRRGLPRGSAVAGLAGLREAGLGVGRVIGRLEGGKMAAHASGGRPREFSSQVAGRAGQRDVCSSQRESRKLQVVKRGAEPVIRAVALFTCGGET